jgi:hypothetical protein
MAETQSPLAAALSDFVLSGGVSRALAQHTFAK